MVDKPKICKCGHAKINHYKNPQSKWKSLGQCQSCPCSFYLNRLPPNKIDKFGLIYGIGFIAFFGFVILAPFTNEDVMNTKITIHASIIFLLLGMVFVMFSIYIISPLFIESYFYAKKRKE